MTTPTKRKYTRLSPSIWAELRALWETGDHDLAELSDRYGVSRRAIQSHLKKLGSVKGARAIAMAVAVKKEIFKEETSDPETLVLRAKDTRDAAYAHAVIIDALVVAQLALAQKDPTQAFKAATAMKMLSLAAATLERTQGVRLRALGLDKENALSDEMPVLLFRDLSKEEITALAERNEDGQEDDLGIPIAPSNIDSTFAGTETYDSDDIVEEGSETENADIVVEGVDVVTKRDDGIVRSNERDDLAKLYPEALAYPGGGRLVKGALP